MPPSIIGADGLNGPVRDGKECDPIALRHPGLRLEDMKVVAPRGLEEETPSSPSDARGGKHFERKRVAAVQPTVLRLNIRPISTAPLKRLTALPRTAYQPTHLVGV